MSRGAIETGQSTVKIPIPSTYSVVTPLGQLIVYQTDYEGCKFNPRLTFMYIFMRTTIALGLCFVFSFFLVCHCDEVGMMIISFGGLGRRGKIGIQSIGRPNETYRVDVMQFDTLTGERVFLFEFVLPVALI